MGTVFLYISDEDGYRKITARAIALAPAATNWQDQLAILHIAARGPFTFSTEQKSQCEKLIQSVERGLSRAPADEKPRAGRAISAMQLRLGDLTNALAHLEKALSMVTEPAGRGLPAFFIKALCLHRMGRIEESRATFAEAEAILKPALLDRLSQFEGFLSDADRYDILLHREAQAPIGLK